MSKKRMEAGGGGDMNIPKGNIQMSRFESYDALQQGSDDSFGSKLFQCGLSFGGALYILSCLPFACLGGGPVVKVNEGNRAAVLKFGKLDRIVTPGTYSRNIGSEQFIVKSVQIQTLSIPTQTILTRDNVPVALQAVCFYRIDDMEKAVFGVNNCERATQYISQSILETSLGEKTLEEILSNRAKIVTRVAELIDKHTSDWGIHVQALEIRDIRVPAAMERVMASTAEAKSEGEAKVVMALCEMQAAETYAQAADILSDNPGALQLRYFQTLSEIAAQKNTTILVPSEITNMFRPLNDWGQPQSYPSKKGKEKSLEGV